MKSLKNYFMEQLKLKVKRSFIDWTIEFFALISYLAILCSLCVLWIDVSGKYPHIYNYPVKITSEKNREKNLNYSVLLKGIWIEGILE
jgi:hypothetical protein